MSRYKKETDEAIRKLSERFWDLQYQTNKIKEAIMTGKKGNLKMPEKRELEAGEPIPFGGTVDVDSIFRTKMDTKPIISVENSGNVTRVKFLGIDISKALTDVSYRTAKLNNSITLDINIVSLIDVLCEITPEDLEKAQEILAPYKESRAHLKEIIS